MVSEHIYRDWTGHKKETIRPSNEYAGIEIFSYDHELTQSYYSTTHNFQGSNFKQVNHRKLTCLESKNANSFTVDINYNCLKKGDYRIDIVYENKNKLDYTGSYKLELTSSSETKQFSSNGIIPIDDTSNLNSKIKSFEQTIEEKTINFDGELNILKRNTIYETLTDEGLYKLTFTIPSNCYFIGVIIRKIKLYTGDINNSAGTNILFNNGEITFKGMTEPAEASLEIGYSQEMDCNLSRSGFYIDYMDEVNIYVKENDNEFNELNKPIRRFGGYVSSIELDDDRSHLNINCADRLQDGESEYILDAIIILGGTADLKEFEYLDPLDKSNYAEVLKYLCDIYEITLKNTISAKYTVENELYSTGLPITFGTKNDVKSVKTTNATAVMDKNSVLLRNNASGKKKQVINLYKGNQTLPPTDITDFLTFHITYGLGDTVSSTKSTTVGVVDNSENAAGSQKFDKYGVSQDGKYIMAVGRPSANGERSKYGYKFYRKIFERKCPCCGSTKLYWGIFWAGNESADKGIFPTTGKREGGSAEGHIFCAGCDVDWSIFGKIHGGKCSKSLTGVSNAVQSSKAEAYKLKQGKMVAVPKTGVKIAPDELFEAISKICKKYNFDETGSTTYATLKKTGKGNSEGFSDLITKELYKYGVECRIYHNSIYWVAYKNAKNQWTVFPYKKYGLSKKLIPKKVDYDADYTMYYKGNNISHITSKASNKSTQRVTVTTTRGYDKDKPINGYFQIKYSTEPSWNAKTKNINLDFTAKAGTNDDLSGLNPIWVNNAQKQSSISMKNWFDDNEPNKRIYLHEINFITPKITTTNKNDTTDWYTFDDQTHDESSCKMDLYSIIFDDRLAINSQDLSTCGKSINEVLSDLIEKSGYSVYMEYGLHRCDDVIHFKVDNHKEVSFTATEGDDNNILEWSNITYNPVSDLRNRSICVFKTSQEKYSYIDTADVESILKYGEKTTLLTHSEQISSKEAYFRARDSDDYNPDEKYSYTILVPYAPYLRLGDIVQVISNYRKLNDIKTLESLKIIIKNDQIPKIQSELGLDEIEPFLRIRKEQEELRKVARSEKTYFSRTANPVEQSEIYMWED